ncbi:hypothetical protein [Sphingobacterium faecium]|uniref:hypothetical protein n=1 Tax=Sphingobacterium faecium TaxID=34087 RepID=UPI00247854EF|nr:hypothetical protein [Sphingobacterium faecium]WGQ15033.1 hypothetical protein QG727_01190 [Sphingobacterium faecium]
MKNILLIFPDWEERSSLGFISNLKNVSYDRICIFKFTNGSYLEETELQIDKIKKAFSRASDLVEVELSNIQNQSSVYIWNEITEFFLGLKSEQYNLYLDISTMPRELIWMFLSNSKNYVPYVNIIYHLPQSYSDEWLSRDPLNPRLLFQHSGIFDLGKKSALIIVTGFDNTRVKQIINFYEANDVYLIVPSGNQFENETRNDVNFCDKVGVKNILRIDAYKDLELLEVRSTIKELLSTHNVILTSLGPKITAISLYNVFCEFPEVALSYVPCKTYNLNYSSGYSKSIINKIIF